MDETYKEHSIQSFHKWIFGVGTAGKASGGLLKQKYQYQLGLIILGLLAGLAIHLYTLQPAGVWRFTPESIAAFLVLWGITACLFCSTFSEALKLLTKIMVYLIAITVLLTVLFLYALCMAFIYIIIFTD